MYANILLSGGGVKGSAHCGAIRALEFLVKKPLHCNAIGTSIGALVALGVVYGRSSVEIYEAAQKAQLERLVGRADNVLDLLLKNDGNGAGLRASSVLKEKIACYMQALSINLDVTFNDIAAVTSKELTVTATALKSGQIHVFSSKQTPGVKAIDALTAAASVPLLFQPCLVECSLFVDGGIMSNFPVDLLPDKEDSLGLNLNPPGRSFEGTNGSTLEYIAHLMFIGGEASDVAKRKAIHHAKLLDIITPIDCGLLSPDVDLTGCGFRQVMEKQAPEMWNKLTAAAGATSVTLARVWQSP